MKINLSKFEGKTYEQYRIELTAWHGVTDLDQSKQGIAIALSFPEQDEHKLREQVFSELSINDLKTEDGFDILLAFLDRKLQKDDISDSWEKFNDFDEYCKEPSQSISDFISTFDQKYNKILRKQMKLPSEILAFKLLKQAKLTNEERLLVLTGMDYNNRDWLYDQAKKSLRKFKGDQVKPISKNSETIKFDPTFLSQHEEALAAAGYIPHSKFNKSKIKQNTTVNNFNRKQSHQITEILISIQNIG